MGGFAEAGGVVVKEGRVDVIRVLSTGLWDCGGVHPPCEADERAPERACAS